MSRLAPLSATLLVLFLAGALQAAELDQARITADAEALIAIGDRSAGSPGAEAAVSVITERLTALGLEPKRLRTSVTTTVDRGSWLEIGGQRLTLTPHRPNRAAVATTGGEPLRGPLIILGRGTPADFQGKNLRGAIVVVDGDSGDAWAEAAQLGAVAAIFRHPDRIDRWNLGRQGLPASLDFPRFVCRDFAFPAEVDGQEATLTASAQLEPVTAWTVAARIPGSGRHSEAVLVSAAYESPASLAALSPGATAAWNTATLLEVARMLREQPTARDVVVVFHGGVHEHFRGLRHFAGALTQDRTDTGYDPRGQVSELHTTQRLLSWRGAALKAAFAIAATRPQISLVDLRTLVTAELREPPVPGVTLPDQLLAAHKETEQFIALLAGRRADELQPGLERLRLAFTPSRRAQMNDEERASHRTAIDTADAEYQRYRTIQQKLDYEQALDPAEDEVIGELVQEGLIELDRHLAIVDRYRDDYASLVDVRDVLAGGNAIHLIGLDLSDGNDRFAAAVKGSYVSWVEELGWLTSGLVKLAEDLNQQSGTVPVAFERAAHDAQDEVDAWFGADYLHDAGVGGLYLPAATLSTVADARLRQGGPQDTLQAFDRTRFLNQVRGLGGFLSAYIDAPFIANRRPKSIRSKAPTIETEVRSIGSKTGFRGFPYPLVLVHRDKNKDWSAAIGWEESYWGNAFGKARIPFVTERHPTLHGGTPVSIYGIDAQGRINAALASGGTMKTKGAIGFTKDQVTDLLPLVFLCERSRIFGVFDPRLMIPLATVSVLSATRDSSPNFFHVENAASHAAAAVFTEPGVPLRITATQGQVGNRMILTGHAALERSGATDDKALAAGIAPGNLSDLTALDSAEDIFRLNDDRLAMLRRNGINPDSLVGLHSLSERHLESAREALADRDYETAIGEGQTAWALAGRVYPSVLSTANDIVYGLVVMLLFAIPFAWICERLFVSGSTIARKVAGFIGFFVVVFLFFFFFHPAFKLATTPMVIFLAFVILIMSTWVIGLLYNRFEFEMEQIRMSGMGMHKADVSRLGTLFATVGLGISNMRRRPMRTFLTALTVVLMTFILLTFASFNPNVGSQRLGLDAAPPYSGILVRQNGWVELAPQVENRIRRATSERFDLHQTRWLSPGPTQPKFPLAGPLGMADVAGIVGITNDDPSGVSDALLRGLASDAPRGFAEDAEWLFLPRDVLTRLGAEVGDEVRLRGVPFKAGLIDQNRLSALTVLGGDPVTPLAYDPSDRSRQDDNARLAALAGDGAPPEETGSAIHLSPAAVAIGSAAALERLGASLRAIALTPKDRAVNIPVEAEELARQVAATLRVGTAGESYLLTSVGRMSVAGLGAVLIPLILGGLIIFSTMLNSVAERGKEIFIFSSLGLAPIHVAALFLVEASIYAVLGGLGGYMLAQLIISTLGFLADLGYGVRPDINYSSFTAVATILLVMATVLLSALYPAWIASKAANPGTVDFKVPDPEGDRLEIAFPFTVAARDVRGLCAFLARYFDSHTEAAGGCFTAADARMTGAVNRFEVAAKVWLAPFDLGISQQFLMACRPTDVRAIYSVHLTLDLLSGQRSAWKRTNLAFLKDLRQQFLVWRTLAPETMDQYRADGGDEDARKRLVARAAEEAQATADSAGLPAAGGLA